jgi:hypothetical protein
MKLSEKFSRARANQRLSKMGQLRITPAPRQLHLLARELYGPEAVIEGYDPNGLGPAESEIPILRAKGRAFPKKSPLSVRRRKPRACFGNAAKMVLDSDRERKYGGDLLYTQGLLHQNGRVIVHAWCITKNDEVMDASAPHDIVADCDYFGVLLPTEAVVQQICRLDPSGWLSLHVLDQSRPYGPGVSLLPTR